MIPKGHTLSIFARLVVMLSLALSVFPVVDPAEVAQAATAAAPSQVAPQAALAAPLAAPTNILHLRVQSARAWAPSGLAAGQAIPQYHWLVTEDDTGDPSVPITDPRCIPQSRGGDSAYPANCPWPAMHSVKGGTSAEVIAQGDETTLNETTGIDTSAWPANDHNPKHSYLISVMAEGFDTTTGHVDGFKIDGQWFTVPLNGTGADPGLVTVSAQPYPLPLLTVRMAVWNDVQTNGAYDTGEPNLAGFEGHIADVLGEVTTDWYGNPLCTTYQHGAGGLMLFGADDKPLIQQTGGHCFSDANGVITIPYLGPDRYSSTVTPPNGQEWFQTSTLEGWHDWDTWAIEGWDGYDPEFVQGAEPFPFAEFGFVQIQNHIPPGGTGSIKGTVIGAAEFVPTAGGLVFGGIPGQKVIGPIDRPLISLIDTNLNDTTVYVGRGNSDGTFQINNVPAGDYVLTYWDEDQAYLMVGTAISVAGGQALDLGVLEANGWWSRVHGKVCFDANRNGKCDPGEAGIAGLSLNLLGRDNALQFYGDNTATTDSNGNYDFPRTYPLGQWVVAQGYWEQFYTVGVTYQTNNQPAETTMMANGGFVDISTYNLIGLDTRMDWAIHTYETPANASLGPTNGGIVGEVVATTTRNELDARFQAIEGYEPGLPGATLHLYAPVKCVPTDPTTIPAGANCTLETTSFGSAYYLTDAATGALKKLSDGPDKISGNPIDLYAPYTSETWLRPTDCVARGADDNPIVEQVLPPSSGGHDCLEGPLMSNQVGNNSVGDFMQVNGNYGFTAIDHDPTTGAALANEIAIPAGDYLVEAVSPMDAAGRPAYEIVKEEDINIFSGDQYVAPGETPLNPPLPNRTPPPTVVPAIPPFLCAGPLHTVNVVSDRSLAHFDPLHPATTQGVYNPDMVDGGGSPYEGMQKPLCDVQLVTVRNGRSATPNFHFKTWSGFAADGSVLPASEGVPLPGRILGLIVDDLNLSTNPKQLFYGEKYGIPNIPIGIYDFANRLVKTVYSDPNGVFEVVLPSTSTYNCPLPAGPCPGMYRFLGNDPGQPGHPNPGFNPGYRTIGAFFEVWPGVTLPADLAPTPVTLGIENPGTQQTHPAACLLNDPAQPTAPKVPELFAVNKPFVRSTDTGAARQITMSGQYFGAAPGQVTLTSATGTVVPLVLSGAWSDTQLTVQVPSTTGPGNIAAGPYQLKIIGSNGQSTVNGVTLHVLAGSYNPTVLEVGPGRTYSPTDPNPLNAAHAVQRALDAAAATSSNKLVVIYPGVTSTFNPTGSYFENIVIKSPVKLQGVGPGGIRADGSYVLGSVLDGLGYGTDGERETAWAATLAAIPTIMGPNNAPLDPATVAPPEGEVILTVATSATQYGSSYKAAIDGLLIQNGDVMDFVPNMNNLGNGTQVVGGNNTPANPNQGGGIVALAATRFLQITNNIIRSNAGAYAGAIRLGTPTVGDNHLDGAHIANNRILNNGGSNLAGAVGIFSGTYGYEVNKNDLCGNFSAEYGGGISHFGLTGNLQANGNRGTNGTPSSIHDNRIYFNGSYDEGGGVIIVGEPPLTPNTFGAGAGQVNIFNNLIEANLANDDGGGLRFLTAGNFPYNVYNNIIVNNISTHEGGGVAIDNAPNVRFYNNTVMKNLTTATAATSNGQPAPAGLSTALNNVFLQATLPAGSPLFSNPLLFNNIFFDNRAGRWDGANIIGIGGTNLAGQPDPNPINHWDIGVPGTSFLLAPTNSIIQQNAGAYPYTTSPTNSSADPAISTPYDVTILGLPWRGNAAFVANTIVAQDVPVTIMGNYHLSGTGSPAFNLGAASKAAPSYQQPPATISAPTTDIDNQGRPALGGFDSGADEFPGAQADLSITKTDGVTSVAPGSVIQYTIAVANAGPSGVALAPVTDNVPAALTGVTWTCTAPGGSTCGAASGSGSINTTVTLPPGGSATFTVNGTVAANASGTLVNTASVAAPAGTGDSTPGNNSATDTDLIAVPLPVLGVLDNFNRANANTLGGNWSQNILFGSASIRVNGQQAFAQLPGQAIWNGATGGGPTYGARQGAAFTFANAPTGMLVPNALILKASGGGAVNPANYIQVGYVPQTGQVEVATTTSGAGGLTTRGTFPTTFASGDTLSAVAYADGTVNVYKTTGSTTTAIGSVIIPTSGPGAWTQGTGGGRIGIQLPFGARIDNFSGGTVP